MGPQFWAALVAEVVVMEEVEVLMVEGEVVLHTEVMVVAEVGTDLKEKVKK